MLSYKHLRSSKLDGDLALLFTDRAFLIATYTMTRGQIKKIYNFQILTHNTKYGPLPQHERLATQQIRARTNIKEKKTTAAAEIASTVTISFHRWRQRS